jgi:uncharacterized protein (TIGR03000 family)
MVMKRRVLSRVGVLVLAEAGFFLGPGRAAAGNGHHPQPTYQTPATLYPFNGPLPFQRYQTHYYSPFSYQMPYLYRSRGLQPWSGYRTHHDWPSEPAKPRKVERPKPEPTAHITIKVPEGAEIWFDDTKMTETGPVRQFYTPPLERGREYSYQVRLRWQQEGRPLTQTHEVVVTAGTHITVDFTKREPTEK